MEILEPTPLLGGLSPQDFMRRHWQRKPLLVRQALPGGMVLLSRAQLFELAEHSEVESRLVVQGWPAQMQQECVPAEGRRYRGRPARVDERVPGRARWHLRHGPLPRRALPPLRQPGWTLLVQGVDLHVDAAHELLARFRFVPDARLDDLMISYASDGGGVGPHVDSYDVFLLQLEGRRRWRVGPVVDPALVAGAPLKILANFTAQHEWLLEPGDMLYLPPGWAHDGVAQGPCMTASVGFRAAGRAELGREVLQRMIDASEPPERDALYSDPTQRASAEPARIPPALQAYAAAAVARVLADPKALACALGEYLSEPKPKVWFDAAAMAPGVGEVRLDARTRMLYDAHFVFINGESFRAAGRDARLMHRLADARRLDARESSRLSAEARDLLGQWIAAGWVRSETA